jgi:Archaeal ATPase.
MELPFDFNKPATGKALVGMTAEIKSFVNSIIERKRGISLYSAPKSGKETLVQNALAQLKEQNFSFNFCEIDLFNIRCYEDFIALFRSRMSECCKNISSASLIPFDIDTEFISDKKVLDLPETLAKDSDKPLIIYLKEFQNLHTIEDDLFTLDQLDKIWSKHTHVRYIISGSSVNVMKHIFEEKMLFYYITDHIDIPVPERRPVRDYIVRTFLNRGRVIEDSEAEMICDITSCSMWYVNQICSICHGCPAGFINNNLINQCRDLMLALHTPRFLQMMLDLTPNQINFVRAVLDGVNKFSSVDILEKYSLNSSANVFRIKDALKKREIITFCKDDSAVFLDPLFKYWLKNYYFA